MTVWNLDLLIHEYKLAKTRIGDFTVNREAFEFLAYWYERLLFFYSKISNIYIKKINTPSGINVQFYTVLS